ncbi:MAG TPA: 2-dehydro-3-deoxygalactonokinase [Vicinamibacterales bacterium]
MIAVLDIGSTNSRAWLVEAGSPAAPRVRARATAPVGIRDAAFAGSPEPVRTAVRRLIDELSTTAAPVAVVGAGMMTSALGIREVPHVAAPAGIAELAGAAVTFEDQTLCAAPLTLVPGVRTDGSSLLETDVMRGEETLVAGLLAGGMIEPGSMVLNAGSHWKLIRTGRDGRIASSRTTLGGEIVRAAATATLLKAALPDGEPPVLDDGWLVRGADAAMAEGLLRAMFAVRLLHLADRTTARARYAFLVGAAIGDDVRALVGCGAIATGQTVVVTGPEQVSAAWVRILARAGIEVKRFTAAEIEAAFLAGAVAVTRAVPDVSRPAPSAEAST